MEFIEGEYYTNKDRYTTPGTFVFKNGEMVCTNIIGSKGEPYVIKNPNPNEWVKYDCISIQKGFTMKESENVYHIKRRSFSYEDVHGPIKTMETKILDFYKFLKYNASPFLIRKYIEHFNLKTNSDDKL